MEVSGGTFMNVCGIVLGGIAVGTIA